MKTKVKLSWCFVDGYLSSKITKWLYSNHIEYKFEYSENDCFLIFENPNDAMWFRLTFIPEPISIEEETKRRLAFYLMKEIDNEIIQSIRWKKNGAN